MKIAKLPNGKPEIFYTLQGEGKNTGLPSVFIRLSLCNLHCKWCDTPYTWNWENTPWETSTNKKYLKSQEIITLTPAEVIEYLTAYPCENFVITGGEPLIQQAEIEQLKNLLSPTSTIEIETNGTISPNKLSNTHQIQYNVSPKLSHSGNETYLALPEESLSWFASNKNTVFKFVIEKEEDLKEIQKLEALFDIQREKIILMPKGTESSAIRNSSLDLSAICLRDGYRFSDRLHVHLWGNSRAK